MASQLIRIPIKAQFLLIFSYPSCNEGKTSLSGRNSVMMLARLCFATCRPKFDVTSIGREHFAIDRHP
jgi:hypothetical protein